ncbi:fumarate hydratase [bacterium]|nr:fumarate hydratase [bacterium]
MRKIFYNEIIEKVARLVEETSHFALQEVEVDIKKALDIEDNALSKKYLEVILENLEMAKKDRVPICQDTGLGVFFVRQGSDVVVEVGDYENLDNIISEGLRQGSKKGYLRTSVVDPLNRQNTKDNAPGVVHIISGKKGEFEVSYLAKGFGSENTSALRMLSPTVGMEGIESFILETVKNAGSKPCPPIYVGVGIGGSFEKAALLSKLALCEMGKESEYRKMELEVRDKINALNIGAGGFGGKTTALDVRFETFPTHIAGLPVAVNISCWAHRFGVVKL